MNTTSEIPSILAGDIGGTKTNLGLFTVGKDGPVLQTLQTFSSQDFSNLEELIAQFLNNKKCTVNKSCFGVAGPVMNGKTKTTNLPWTLSEQAIQDRFQFDTVILINDLVATALSIPVLPEKDLVSLNEVATVAGQNRALIAPGTGLGVSLIPYIENRYVPLDSEGGHVDFAPGSEEQIQLLLYLKKKYAHVSYERLLSGSGLVNIYGWLKEKNFSIEPEWLSEQFKTGDPAQIISENGMNRKDKQCEKALDLFVSILGSVAGNLALTGMATGGVYIGGGIAPKILDRLRDGKFLQAFVGKSRYRGLLEQVPVKVIINDKAALLGAAHHIMD